MPTVSLGPSLSTSMRLSSVSRVLRVACGLTGDDATTGNDAPALSRANVGIAVEGATDAARDAADILLTESSLSPVVHTIRGSRIIFQRMRNCSIYRPHPYRRSLCHLGFCLPIRLPSFHISYHCSFERWYHHDLVSRPCPSFDGPRQLGFGRDLYL
ncbi:hypothetical protein K435DRAFT_162551 [Dendrothele bispora CBS 962.96]|uniref:Uncharacterized protein n=1 Tax=Dendrothele bispora (strain CBS 962.96) TaxID=1314807 RepID=A0A4S8MPM2_DENBC|nr:hypothetical protein K435DRAFT_162551 [Dendrothele bispora CBS 962.96]